MPGDVACGGEYVCEGRMGGAVARGERAEGGFETMVGGKDDVDLDALSMRAR